MDEKPLLAITLGDPCGVGPELVLRSLAQEEIYTLCRPLVIGSRSILERAAGWLDIPGLKFERVEHPFQGTYEPQIVSLIDLHNADPDLCIPGIPGAVGGRAAVEYVFKACDLAQQKIVDAIVTAPTNKQALQMAGFTFAGHTEILAARFGAAWVSMLVATPHLKIIHVSAHVSLEEAIARITATRIEHTIELAHKACLSLGIPSPRIAIAGLNPHAGEGGIYGEQEEKEMLPAIEKTRKKGYQVSNPIPSDVVFIDAAQGKYDIVVAMYHDQGHIAAKLLGFNEGFGMSMGLPVVRTSVSHAAQMDLAGTGKARETSLLAAIKAAVQVVSSKVW